MKVLTGTVELFSADNPEGLLEDLRLADLNDEDVAVVVLGNTYYVRIEGV